MAKKQRKVEITYFKPSGKFYSKGSYISSKEHMFEIYDEVEELFRLGKRPGLVDGHSGFSAYVECPEHELNVPCLIISKA